MYRHRSVGCWVDVSGEAETGWRLTDGVTPSNGWPLHHSAVQVPLSGSVRASLMGDDGAGRATREALEEARDEVGGHLRAVCCLCMYMHMLPTAPIDRSALLNPLPAASASGLPVPVERGAALVRAEQGAHGPARLPVQDQADRHDHRRPREEGGWYLAGGYVGLQQQRRPRASPCMRPPRRRHAAMAVGVQGHAMDAMGSCSR